MQRHPLHFAFVCLTLFALFALVYLPFLFSSVGTSFGNELSTQSSGEAENCPYDSRYRRYQCHQSRWFHEFSPSGH
jgi:hypothetical protein